MLFKFHWNIEKFKYWNLGLGPGLGSISPPSSINLISYNKYTTNILKTYEKIYPSI